MRRPRFVQAVSIVKKQINIFQRKVLDLSIQIRRLTQKVCLETLLERLSLHSLAYSWGKSSARALRQRSCESARRMGKRHLYRRHVSTPLSRNSQKRLGHNENQTKYRNMTRKPQSHVRILIYQTWAIRQLRGLSLHASSFSSASK